MTDNGKHERPGTEEMQPTPVSEDLHVGGGRSGGVSRRTMLAAFGAAGAALAGAGLLYRGSSSQEEAGGLVATTVEGLRTMKSPAPGTAYLVSNEGNEGFFLYKPDQTFGNDDGESVIVGPEGQHYYRLTMDPHQLRRIQRPEVATALSRASGSAQFATGSMAAGRREITLDKPMDFKVGQGILIAGAGAPANREVLALIVENDAIAPGTFSLQLPGEEAQQVPLAASPEKVELAFTAPCGRTGDTALVLDGVEFPIPVSANETPEAIAERVRGWYFEGWTNAGSGNVVLLTAKEPGKRRDSFLYGQGTGVAATVSLTKGARTTSREVAEQLKKRTYAKWETGGYSYSNVVFFIAKQRGAMGGHTVKIQSPPAGMTGRIEIAQIGGALITTVTAVNGLTVSVRDPSLSDVSGVYVCHDDTVALQAALTAAKGGVIDLPPGTYRLSKSLLPQAGTVVRGSGKTATILQFQMLGQAVQITNGAHDVCISHLQVKNVCYPDAYFGGDSERHGIAIDNAKRVVIEHCWIDNADDGGIRAGGSTFGTRLLHNVITNTAEGSGIEVIRGEECLLIGNYVARSSQHAVRLCGARKPIAIGNTLEDNRDGFSIQGYGDGKNVTVRVQDFVIEGNVIKDHVSYGIAIFNQANNGIIKGNWMEGTQGQIGFYIRHVTIGGRKSTNFQLLIEGNVCKGFSQAVQLTGDHQRLAIRGNLFADYAAYGSANGCGIYMSTTDQGDLRDIWIENNTFISPIAGQQGILLEKPSMGSRVQVHHNTFLMRLDDPSRAEDAAIRVKAETGYNPNALIRTRSSTCSFRQTDGRIVTGTMEHDTNSYDLLPV